MKSVAILQHAPGEGPGFLGQVFGRYRVEHEVLHVHAETDVPRDTDELQGLVLLGGPVSVGDGLPWMAAEQALVRRALERRIPVLGICLGAQLIAAALGARVSRNPVPEIGWGRVAQVRGDETYRWFGGLPGTFEAFHWHEETFDLPAGAQLVLSSQACRNQAFTLGTALGLQCHVEVTAAMVRDWSAHAPSTESRDEMLRDLDVRIGALHGIAEHLFSCWIASL